MQIGIGVTTRNRYKVLALCLSRFDVNRSPHHKYTLVVYDDNSKSSTEALCNQNYDGEIIHAYAGRQSGVTAGKNYCLTKLKGCDYVFLFDDDCFPRRVGWEDCFITASAASHDNVMMYTRQGALRTHKVERYAGQVNYFNIGAGCCMFITRKALDVLGGYNPEYSFYGHEHNGYCFRAHRSGLNAHPFVSPVNASEFIYSLDIDGAGRYRTMIGGFQSADPLPVRDYYERRGRAAYERDKTGETKYYPI